MPKKRCRKYTQRTCLKSAKYHKGKKVGKATRKKIKVRSRKRKRPAMSRMMRRIQNSKKRRK